MMWTDEISYDPGGVDEWGRPLSASPIDVLSRVEWIDELVRDKNGKLRKADLLIGVPAGTAAAFVSGGRIQLRRLKGVPVNDFRWFEVLAVYHAGGFIPSHTELRCG